MVVGVPALGVSHGQPADEPRQVAVGSGPDNEMEMVGHDAVGQDAHRRPARGGLGENAKEGVVVAVILEDRARATARFKAW